MADPFEGDGQQRAQLPLVEPANRAKTSTGQERYNNLAESLRAQNRHPVLIFGASQAGKTEFILSLFEALSASKEVNVALGAPVLPGHPDEDRVHGLAERLFDWGRWDRREGNQLAGTRVDPFFIPIDVKPKNDRLEPVKLALLDGMGELYEPNLGDRMGSFRRAINPDVLTVLQHYTRGITSIYLVPATLPPEARYSFGTASFTIDNIIKGYDSTRSDDLRQRDFHLFLLTKWDEVVGSKFVRKFDYLTPEDVESEIESKFPDAWGAFGSLPVDGQAMERRAFMQYCAGYFSDGRVSRPPDNRKASFERYPLTVMNWLYGNATRETIDLEHGTMVLRRILFESVLSPSEPKLSLTDWALRLLTSR